MKLQTLSDIDVKGKKVLLRVDFNVPLTKSEPYQITDGSRIDLCLPTIEHLLSQGASKIIIMSHLGRPKNSEDKKYSLDPVATYLAEKLKKEVILTPSAIDAGVKELLTLPETKIVLLENLRFHPEEEKNDSDFAEKLSKYGDLYVNDAFGAAHRKHASVHQINSFFKGKRFAGLLLQKEIQSLQKILHSPDKPFVALIGGAKVSDKIKTLEKLLVLVDSLLIGGAMCYPFLKAQGLEIGKSLCSEEDVKLASSLIKMDKGKKLKFPIDHIISSTFDGEPESVQKISIDKMGLDIGPMTIEQFSKVLTNARTIFWNGPMGYFENINFSQGTMKLAENISHTNAFTVVGGGDSVSAVQKSGLYDKFSHVSTGGGASLEFIEKGELPGIQALIMGV